MVTEEDESLLTSKEVTIYSSQATRTCQHNTDKQVCGMNSHPELGGEGGEGQRKETKQTTEVSIHSCTSTCISPLFM